MNEFGVVDWRIEAIEDGRVCIVCGEPVQENEWKQSKCQFCREEEKAPTADELIDDAPINEDTGDEWNIFLFDPGELEDDGGRMDRVDLWEIEDYDLNDHPRRLRGSGNYDEFGGQQ